MPPTKSQGGKLADNKKKNTANSKGPVITGMKGRMTCSNGVKVTGMKAAKSSSMKVAGGNKITGMKGSGMKVTGMKGSGMKVIGMKGSGMKGSGMRSSCADQSGVKVTGMKVTGMKVTGMKGRMGGTQMKGGGLKQQNLPFKAVKNASKKKAKKKLTTAMILSGNKQQDEALLKLRIPLDICTVLPSIKKFTAKSKSTKGKRKPNNMIFEVQSSEQSDMQLCFSKKQIKLFSPIYHVEQLQENRLQGMIWDLAFTEDGKIVVTGSEGAFLCDSELKVISKLDNMFLPGAISFLSDGRILIVDRSSDTVNIYRKNATFLRSFEAGNCPMGMAVNSLDEIIVSDTGDKCVRKFDKNGKNLMTIPTVGDKYNLRWPLYLDVHHNNEIVVSDVHQQKVLRFDTDGSFLEIMHLKTHGGSCVLRPHGVCVTKRDEIMVVDTAIESLELFSRDGTYLQTVLIPDSGVMSMDPKLCKLNKDNTLLGVGGLTGIVRTYNVTELKRDTAEKERKPRLPGMSVNQGPVPETRSQASTSGSLLSAGIKQEPLQEVLSH